MNIIVAVDKNWAIGKNNKMMWSIPADMRFFREKTTGHVVVMGRKTLESFPNGLPLKQRTNIVLSRDKNYQVKGALAVHTMEELLEHLKGYASEEIFIIGGESIYRQFLPYCDTAYVTKIDHAYDADTHFPNLDEMPEWEMTEAGGEQTSFDLEFVFTKYERKSGGISFE
ncbi:dihydrofolate reductase [Schaedlerella arabinosiphila]|uniref:dihydrofolate reductase n=1 Tax=Schaedlerella arabinosiphila TaxID=2044587 RepID=UPI002557E9D7|nr:dihydrofolate reductase [Schaedlerella arabinosiphila]